ncbi:MAG: Spy/CpxP family protein refolding chaperone [Deltaproteobacteria bacterium]|nr:Spy/CpxP family protein refolding chaperone [Deltaproteobacteria bacterium]
METALSALKVVGVVAAAALLGAGLVTGCRAHGRHAGATPAEIQERVDDGLAHLERKIDATEEQKAKIAALKDRLMPDLLNLRKSHDAAAREAASLWSAPSLDTAALDALVDTTVEELRGTAHKLIQAAAELHAVLTPEQRQKLADLHERRCRW